MKTLAQYTAEGAFHFTTGVRGFLIPFEMREALVAYVEERRPVGGFLTAVIENDLREAVGRADGFNLDQLPAFVNFFYNHAPSTCWGSRAKMDAWLAPKETT